MALSFLVVIAIIAILAALLLSAPAGQGKEKAKRIVWLTQQRAKS
jgi:hypothetical protein